MSRLIDADKLPATCNVAIVNGKVELNSWIAAQRITEAPTVPAIPIEWIEKQIAERENYGDFNTAAAIGYLLLSWEKENERETN